uniref:uncharacterized protein troap n=1 Tax=Semicossyphus pulcher TaxID=241346 RepID=UPI0037E8D6AE
MDSSPVLRLQSQNKIRSDFLRMKNEHNKMPAQLKASKLQSALKLPDQNIENQDPGSSQMGRKAPVRPGISRLPVLAKSLHLQTPSDFSQSHCRWEEKPLAGKAKKKRPCTRPIPFNLSQPKSSRVASENQQPLTLSQPRTGTHAVQPDNNVCNGHLRTKNINSKPTKQATFNSNVDLSKGTGKSNGKATVNTPQLSGQSVLSTTFKTSTTLSQPLSSASNKALHQNHSATSSAQSALTTEACLDNMNLLSLKDSTKSSHASKNMQLATQGNFSKCSTDKGESFQPDNTALLSILRNEGLSAAGLGSPQSKPYNYVPQRVSIMKSRQKAGLPTDKGENFQPDHTALLSILRNEGLSAAGLGSPQCKPYNYVPQRVSIMKSRQKAGPPTDKGESFQPDHTALLSILRNEGLSAAGLGSPQCKPYNYVPQRVSIMKSQQKAGPPTASVKSVQFSPDPTALQSILQNEGVKAGRPVDATPRNPVRPSGRGTSVYTAQRVPVKKNHAEAAGGPAAVRLKETPQKTWTPQRVRDTRHQPMSAMKLHVSTPYGSTPGLRSCKTNLQPRQEEVVQRLFDDPEDQQNTSVTEKDPETQAEQQQKEDEEEEEDEEQQRIVGGQPFIQAPQRESVIFFSTGKKLLRAPRFEKQESSADHEQHGPVSSAQREMLPVHEGKSSVSEPACQINPAVHSLHRDLGVVKTSKSPALAMLRKRLPQLEELRMDEEVATYTSVAVQAAPGFVPPRPRCGNPLASILHFEEFSRFVPISCGLSSGPSSPQSSPLQER